MRRKNGRIIKCKNGEKKCLKFVIEENAKNYAKWLNIENCM